MNTRVRFSIFWFIAGCILTGCSLVDKRPTSELQKSTQQRVFYAQYDIVWRAAHTVIKYPIAAENQDTGQIETEYIRAVDGWRAPETNKPPSSGIRYKLIFTFAKGKIEGRESTRVTLEKKIERQSDFFSEPEGLDSDGLEEKVIFYRMERELVISETLKKSG